MKKTIWVIVLSLIFGLTALAEAALINQGGGLIYCDTLDITLLQNANYAGRLMTWDEAMEWAENLEYYDSVRGVTWDDWRLPTTVDGVFRFGYEGDPDEDGIYSYTYGYNLANSEMGHIYYTELENLGYYATDGTNPQDGWGLKNKDPFENLQPFYYWSGTEYAYNPDGAWRFLFSHGHQLIHSKGYLFYAWAVRSGNVAAVPEPATGLLFLSLILGIAGIMVDRQRHG